MSFNENSLVNTKVYKDTEFFRSGIFRDVVSCFAHRTRTIRADYFANRVAALTGFSPVISISSLMHTGQTQWQSRLQIALVQSPPPASVGTWSESAIR